MKIEQVEEKLANMHFDSIVKSYCNKVNDIERLKAENKKMNEQLRLHSVSQRSELLTALKECRRWMINKGVNVDSKFFKNIDKAINCG